MQFVDSSVTEFRPTNLVIDLSRQCTETCGHCVVEASPFRTEKLPTTKVAIAMMEARANGIEDVCFYGGEPFASKELLWKGIESAYAFRRAPQVMTNGFWGHTAEFANKIFDRIAQIQNGLFQPTAPLAINISSDRYHTKVTPKHIATIIAVWLTRDDCDVDLGLTLGDFGGGDDLDQFLDQIADEFEVSSSSKWAGLEVDMLGMRHIRFIEKYCAISQEAKVDEILLFLEREELTNAYHLAELRDKFQGTDDSMAMYAFIRANDWCQLLHTAEDEAAGTYTLGKLHSKTLRFDGYTLLLTGAGRQFLTDESVVRETAEKRRQLDDPYRRLHEHVGTLILGSDNLFYLHPAQLNLRVSPVGVNKLDGMREAISRVNAGEPIAGILLAEDPKSVLLAARTVDQTLARRIQEVVDAGLNYEAIIEGLRDPRVIAHLRSEAPPDSLYWPDVQ